MCKAANPSLLIPSVHHNTTPHFPNHLTTIPDFFPINTTLLFSLINPFFPSSDSQSCSSLQEKVKQVAYVALFFFHLIFEGAGRAHLLLSCTAVLTTTCAFLAGCCTAPFLTEALLVMTFLAGISLFELGLSYACFKAASYLEHRSF
jgi:hypothetical protein